jgi:hypothetical protein
VMGMAGIGPGDDVALLGRFITHDGRQRNKPLARFGNIAKAHDNAEPIEIAPGKYQVGFLVECRSLSGFSGSPVFVYPDVAGRPDRSAVKAIASSQFKEPLLLGVDCAHFPVWSRVCEERDRETAHLCGWVDTNSGISVVIPAWRLTKLLMQDHLVRATTRLRAPPETPDTFDKR